MSDTLLLVHSGHKTCTGQITEQVLLIDTVGRKGENGRVGWLSQVWLYCAGAWPNRVLQQFCYFYLTIQLQKCPWQTGIQLYTCIAFISEARPSILEGQILWIDSFLPKYFFRNFKTDDRPVSPWSRHKPEFSYFGSAVLRWHRHTGVHGRFGRFGVFSLTASHFLPQLGRYHGLYACTIDPPDTQASPPMQVCLCSAQERDPEHPWKEPFGVKFL